MRGQGHEELFIAFVTQGHTFARAARMAGVDPATIRDWMRNDPEFQAEAYKARYRDSKNARDMVVELVAYPDDLSASEKVKVAKFIQQTTPQDEIIDGIGADDDVAQAEAALFHKAMQGDTKALELFLKAYASERYKTDSDVNPGMQESAIDKVLAHVFAQKTAQYQPAVHDDGETDFLGMPI